MTDFEPEIVEVATTRIGPSPRQSRDRGVRRPLSVIIVILVALAIPVVAFIGPRGEQRLDLTYLIPTPATPGPSPTATPRPTPTPPPPTPSPPPVLTTGDGPVPDSIPINSGGIRLIDPSTGEMGPPSRMRGDSDAIFRGPNGGWWCVCFDRDQTGQQETMEIVVRHLDSTAVETAGSEAIATIESVAAPPAQDFDIHVDVELSPNGRIAFVATAARSAEGWNISLRAIDLRRGTSIGQVDLAPLAVPPPTAAEVNEGYGTWLAGPNLRLAPGGDRLLVSYWLEKSTATATERQAVSVSVRDVSGAGQGGEPLGVATALGGAFTEAIPTCGWMQWLTNESILGMCWRENQASGEAPIDVATFGLDGSRLASIDYTPDPETWIAEPVLDLANRRLYLWSPVAHKFDVVELDSGNVQRLAVGPELSSQVSGVAIGRATQPPDWAAMYSDYVPWSSPSLLADPRGTRLFAIGMKDGPESSDRGRWLGSTGIWVFDTETPQLVDRWDAAAPYSGLGLSRDNHWIYAISPGGADTDGNPSGWPPALSVHDARNGRLALQLADFAPDEPLQLAP